MGRTQRRAANRRMEKAKQRREREKLQKKKSPGKFRKFISKFARSSEKK